MTDEPFTSDQNIVYESGIPVRLYSGGKLGAGSTPLPPVGDEGDVLTVVGGEPEWSPPASAPSGPTTVYPMDPLYWLTPYGQYMSPWSMPYPYFPWKSPFGPNAGTFGFCAPQAEPDFDELSLGSGTGTTILVSLPETTDGQTLATTRGGYDVSVLCPFPIPGATTHDGVGWRLRLLLGATRTGTMRIINDTSPITDANSYYVDTDTSLATNQTLVIPSGINLTQSNPSQVYFSCELSSSTTWELQIGRWSFDL